MLRQLLNGSEKETILSNNDSPIVWEQETYIETR